MLLSVAAVNLFPSAPVIHFRPQRSSCVGCHQPLKVQKTLPHKRAATLAIGEFIAHETVYYCPGCGGTYHSTELQTVIPENCNFGYDIIVFIGESLFLHCRNYHQIRGELKSRNVGISESEIAFLAKKFVLSLGLLHRSVQRKTRAYMQMNGGYILHLDGTCDGGSPHLISVLDGITEIVLDNCKLPSENAEELIPFLQSIKKAYGVPLAVVSDMGKGIAVAVEAVFKNVSLFICHYHFLKSVGKNLFGDEYDLIRERLRKHNVHTILKRAKTRLEKLLPNTTPAMDALLTGLKGERLSSECPMGAVPPLAAYTLINWVMDGEAEGNGFGFPFDQTHLVFYQRLQEVALRLHQLYTIRLQGDWKENKVYSTISHDLLAVINDQVLRKAAVRMQEKVAVFNQLRTAMRITLPENRRGLNDTGELPVGMKTIEKEVAKFRSRLSKSKGYSEQKADQKLVEQLDTYWEKLFADPIAVTTPAGRIFVQPQRTNNILEQFFRRLMRTYRKKNGFNSMARILKAMLPDTPLAMNLNNEQYMQILLAGKKTLEERFAEIDSKELRGRLEQSRNATNILYPQLRKIIRIPDLPKSLVSLLEQAAS
jgi:hypothetical protein